MFERRLYYHIDWALLTALLALCGIGLAMIYSATATGRDEGTNSVTLKITSPSADIKSFKIATDDPNNGGLSYGLGFGNIVWS